VGSLKLNFFIVALIYLLVVGVKLEKGKTAQMGET